MMGLDANGIRFLLYARKRGIDFSRTAMIGRQSLDLNASALTRNLRDFGVEKPAEQSARIMSAEKGYAESFLQLLGAREIVSFDASDYEGATCIHDFNLPLDKKYFRQFSVVLDSGTLEHIFNFPQAISNCMEMVDLGGHFLGITPGNNSFGHGFYQFSPELFFRIFGPDNGFSLRQMLAFESPSATWYEVADPETVGRRVTFINWRETYLLVTAERIAIAPIFASTIQQSDYSAQWHLNRPDQSPARLVDRWRNLIPTPLKRPARTARDWMRSHFAFDKRYFRKIHIP